MFLVITATVIAYQFLVEKFFTPSKENLPTQNKVLKQKNETNLELPSTPQLMLGSYRNSINLPDSLVLDLKDVRVIFTSVGGKIKSYYIKNYKEDLVTKEEKELKIFPLEIFTGDPSLDQKLDFSNYNLQKEGNKVVATLNLGNISVEKSITFDNEGFISSVDIKLNGYNKPFYVLVGSYLKEDQMHTHAGPILDINGSIERIDPEDIKGYKVYKGNISFAGEESRFFFEGFVGKIFSAEVFRIDLKKNDFTSLILVSGEFPLKAYYGPKEYSYLKKANLESVIDFGLLEIIAKPLFVFLISILKAGQLLYLFLHWLLELFYFLLLIKVWLLCQSFLAFPRKWKR